VTGERADHQLDPAEKAGPILRALDARYGRKDRPAGRDPLEALIRGVLSQNTTDANSARAYESLRERFGDWGSLAAAPPARVEAAIRSGGLARQKAATILAIMRRLKERGRYSLDFLRKLDSAEAERRLAAVKGVGIKTARLVLLFALERPVFVVDTHVHRVTRRVGLIPPTATREKAHHLLDALISDGDKYSGHMNIIEHGRRVCHARSPECGACVLRRWCAHSHEETP